MDDSSSFELRNYQHKGIEFFQRNKKRLNADVPGLGKTVQAIYATPQDSPLLVVCPNYLLHQWSTALEEHTNRRPIIIAGSKQDKEEALSILKALAKQVSFKITLIVSYNLLQDGIYTKYILDIVQPNWTFIVDESHNIRSWKSHQSSACFRISKITQNVFLLSATPAKREVDDLFGQLRCLDPKVFTSYWAFVDQWCKTYVTPWSTQVVGVKDPVAFRNMLSRYLIKRTYEEVHLELPPIIQSVIEVDFSEGERAIYENIINTNLDILDQPIESQGALYIKLRQRTLCDAKFKALYSLLEDLPSALIFVWYRESARKLRDYFGYETITGEQNLAYRQTVLDSKPKHLIATISSISEGIDLSYMQNVIFIEEDFLPGTMYQAQSRVHRFGITEPVLLYKIRTADSIDIHVANRQERRDGSITSVLGDCINTRKSRLLNAPLG